MALSEDTFLGSRGLTENPFILTNADEEQNLSSYFVPPPFFDAVLGSAAEPKSCTVFAPRGGGKTAQKVMIEGVGSADTLEGAFLCLTYDRFILPDGFKTKDATLDWHLLNLVRLLCAATLVRIDELADENPLDQEEKDFLVKASRTFLFEINVAEFQSIIGGMRNWRGKTEDVLKKYGGQIANLLSAIAAKFDIGKIENIQAERAVNKPTLIAYFERLVRLCRKIGYSSVYILVDRIDETSITQNDANSSFEFIESLALDLHVLETKGVAFKFFLWDQIRSKYVSAGARTDRVPLYSLSWNLSEMSEMLSERLKAYSGGKVASFNDFLDPELEFDAHSLMCLLAAGSPRDMIRMCKAVIDNQTRISNKEGMLTRQTISAGIKAFADQRALELFGNSVEDLRKVGLASFTISKLANDVFRISTNAVSRKIQIWTDQGAVVRSGEVPTPGSRPQNLYSLADPRLTISAKNQYPVESILDNSIFCCASCNAVIAFEPEDIRSCYACQAEVSENDSVFKRIAPTL